MPTNSFNDAAQKKIGEDFVNSANSLYPQTAPTTAGRDPYYQTFGSPAQTAVNKTFHDPYSWTFGR